MGRKSPWRRTGEEKMKRNQNASSVYLSRWPKDSDTYKTMHGALDRIARLLGGPSADKFDWGEMRYEDTRAVAAKLGDAGLKPRTVNKMLSALRGALESAWRLGQIPDEEYRRIKIENVPGRTLASGRRLEDDEVEALFKAMDAQTPQDAAIIAIMCACGLRRIEMVRLKREDYVDGELTAFGKGNKMRSIPVPPRWQPFIERWIVWLKGTDHPSAFMFAGVSEDQALTRAAISHVIARFVKSTGMKHFSPHDLRRTFITRVNEKSDIAIAQRLAGHANLNTTTIYDRRGKAAEKKAVEDL